MSSPQQPKRRQFFKIASAGTVATASGGLSMMLMPEAALAAEVLGADALKTLTKMARDIFPHDRFEDTLYTNAVSGYGEQAKADEKLKKLLLDGVAKLNTEANKKFKKPYAEVEKEADRVSILKGKKSQIRVLRQAARRSGRQPLQPASRVGEAGL